MLILKLRREFCRMQARRAKGKLRAPPPGHYATLKPEGGGGRVGKVSCTVLARWLDGHWTGASRLVLRAILVVGPCGQLTIGVMILPGRAGMDGLTFVGWSAFALLPQ